MVNRVLRDQVLSIGTGTGKFPQLVPQMRSGLGNLYSESRYRDQDRECNMGPYLVPGLSNVPGFSIGLTNETKIANFTPVVP